MSDITGIEDNYMYDKPEDAIHALEMKVTAYQKGVEVGERNPIASLKAWGNNPKSQIENFIDTLISSQPDDKRYKIYERFIRIIMREWRKDSEYYS